MFGPKMESLDYHVKKILDENPNLKPLVSQSQQYQSLLEQKTKYIFEKYKSVLHAGLLVDKWDRLGAKIKLGIEFIAKLFGVGGIAKVPVALLDTLELVYKIPYSIYYAGKTGDLKGTAGYALNEAASMLLPFGSLFDFRNNYVNRAKKFLREKVAKDFESYVKAKGLEQMMAQGARPA